MAPASQQAAAAEAAAARGSRRKSRWPGEQANVGWWWGRGWGGGVRGPARPSAATGGPAASRPRTGRSSGHVPACENDLSRGCPALRCAVQAVPTTPIPACPVAGGRTSCVRLLTRQARRRELLAVWMVAPHTPGRMAERGRVVSGRWGEGGGQFSMPSGQQLAASYPTRRPHAPWLSHVTNMYTMQH